MPGSPFLVSVLRYPKGYCVFRIQTIRWLYLTWRNEAQIYLGCSAENRAKPLPVTV